MDIAALSTQLSQMSIKQQANISLIGKAMEITKVNSDVLTKALEQSVRPELGSNIDIKI